MWCDGDRSIALGATENWPPKIELWVWSNLVGSGDFFLLRRYSIYSFHLLPTFVLNSKHVRWLHRSYQGLSERFDDTPKYFFNCRSHLADEEEGTEHLLYHFYSVEFDNTGHKTHISPQNCSLRSSGQSLHLVGRKNRGEYNYTNRSLKANHFWTIAFFVIFIFRSAYMCDRMSAAQTMAGKTRRASKCGRLPVYTITHK